MWTDGVLTESSESSVDAVRSVGGGHYNNVRPLLQPIHEGEQLGDDTTLYFAVSLHSDKNTGYSHSLIKLG